MKLLLVTTLTTDNQRCLTITILPLSLLTADKVDNKNKHKTELPEIYSTSFTSIRSPWYEHVTLMHPQGLVNCSECTELFLENFIISLNTSLK